MNPISHNPDNLSPDQIALIPGLRLLDEDEIIYEKPSPLYWWSGVGWSTDPDGCCFGSSRYMTYGTLASRAELRAARALPPEPAAESATPRTEEQRIADGACYICGGKTRAGWCSAVHEQDAVLRELAAAQSEIERLTKEREELTEANLRLGNFVNDEYDKVLLIAERDELRGRVATLEGAAAELLRQLSYAFWTSDDGLEQRPGSPEDAPNERLGKAWSALAALSK